MRLSDFFQHSNTDGPKHTWTLVSHDPRRAPIAQLAEHLADQIMECRCIGCQHHYYSWKRRTAGGPPLSPSAQRALSDGFVKPLFGLPSAPIPPDHLEGGVAQYLWFFLTSESTLEPIVRVERPGFAATDHGGDGLAVHRAQTGDLMFRLWEIKKNTGQSAISSTVNTAYGQLNTRATEYLARYTAIGQELPDAEIAEFYGKLADLWIDACPEAAAGVSVATNSNSVPETCFSTFGDQFPRFATPRRLKGMLTAIDDFPAFCREVQKAVWKGL